MGSYWHVLPRYTHADRNYHPYTHLDTHGNLYGYCYFDTYPYFDTYRH